MKQDRHHRVGRIRCATRNELLPFTVADDQGESRRLQRVSPDRGSLGLHGGASDSEHPHEEQLELVAPVRRVERLGAHPDPLLIEVECEVVDGGGAIIGIEAGIDLGGVGRGRDIARFGPGAAVSGNCEHRRIGAAAEFTSLLVDRPQIDHEADHSDHGYEGDRHDHDRGALLLVHPPHRITAVEVIVIVASPNR